MPGKVCIAQVTLVPNCFGLYTTTPNMYFRTYSPSTKTLDICVLGCIAIPSQLKTKRTLYHVCFILTLVFLPGLRPGSYKNFADLTRTYHYSFSVYYSELRSSPVLSKRSSFIISKAPD